MRGGERHEGFDPGSAVGAPDPNYEPHFSIPPEPFAIIAFGAALAGLSLVLVRATRTRLLGAAIAGAVGAGSLVLLALSPTLRALGLNAVTLLYGFWITLGIFGLANRGSRSPATVQRNEGEASPPGTVTGTAANRVAAALDSTLEGRVLQLLARRPRVEPM